LKKGNHPWFSKEREGGGPEAVALKTRFTMPILHGKEQGDLPKGTKKKLGTSGRKIGWRKEETIGNLNKNFPPGSMGSQDL